MIVGMNSYSYRPVLDTPMTSETSDEYFHRLVDEGALRAYLKAHLGAVTTYEVERHQAGHSNETLYVTWGDREFVLRRPPPGETAEGAHDVLREYRVMDALQDTPVRVPPTVLACDDHDVIGADFYLMERVAGDVIRTDEPDRFATAKYRERIGEELLDALTEIHNVDYTAIGLDEFGHPSGFIERQVAVWHRQHNWAADVTDEVRPIPRFDEVGDWLDDNIPDSHPHTLMHGDYKLDNVLFAPGAPPVLDAIFDWELSTLGDPLFDFGYMLIFWRDPKDPPPAVPELIPTFTDQPGYPRRVDLVDRYEAKTGLAFEHERFYRTLAVYKLAAFCEMFFRRYLEGNADDPMYPVMEDRVPKLADRALRIIDGDEPL